MDPLFPFPSPFFLFPPLLHLFPHNSRLRRFWKEEYSIFTARRLLPLFFPSPPLFSSPTPVSVAIPGEGQHTKPFFSPPPSPPETGRKNCGVQADFSPFLPPFSFHFLSSLLIFFQRGLYAEEKERKEAKENHSSFFPFLFFSPLPSSLILRGIFGIESYGNKPIWMR